MNGRDSANYDFVPPPARRVVNYTIQTQASKMAAKGQSHHHCTKWLRGRSRKSPGASWIRSRRIGGKSKPTTDRIDGPAAILDVVVTHSIHTARVALLSRQMPGQFTMHVPADYGNRCSPRLVTFSHSFEVITHTIHPHYLLSAE